MFHVSVIKSIGIVSIYKPLRKFERQTKLTANGSFPILSGYNLLSFWFLGGFWHIRDVFRNHVPHFFLAILIHFFGSSIQMRAICCTVIKKTRVRGKPADSYEPCNTAFILYANSVLKQVRYFNSNTRLTNQHAFATTPMHAVAKFRTGLIGV